MKDFWKALFNKGGADKKLSGQQCAAARAIFGNTADIKDRCEQVDLPTLVKEAMKLSGTSKLFDDMRAFVATGQGQISELKEFRLATKKKAFEQASLTPRGTIAMFGQDWVSGALEIEKPPNESQSMGVSSWTDDIDAFTKRQPGRENVYGTYDLRMGSVRR